ncbi:MAG: hypothetical protein R3F59_16870 [Myxococcota bacterium]
MVTHGLTHGLSLVAALFADAETTVLLPDPGWENYDLVFRMSTGARLALRPVPRRPVRPERPRAGAAVGAGAQGRARAQLPVEPARLDPPPPPGAPSSRWSRRTRPAGRRDRRRLPGLGHEPDAQVRSLFWDLAEATDPERALVVKADGATKGWSSSPRASAS